ncbi:MAG: CDP-archaeol synthase [Planctomycetota bacterium]
MLKRRLISAGIIIPSIIGILWLDHWLGTDGQVGRPGLILIPIMILTACLAALELVEMFFNVASQVNRKAIIVGTALMVLVMATPVLWRDYPPDCILGRFGFVFSGFVVAMVVTFLFEMLGYRVESNQPKGEVIDRLARSVLIFGYLAMFFGFLIPHRYLANNSIGILAIVLVFTTVKLSDATAYFAGKRFGTIKLAPQLSPGKTVQGAIGALIGGVVGALIVGFPVARLLFGIPFPQPIWWLVAFGVIVTLAGMMGDLAESLMKRDLATKDSSSWLPGLGGVLDIMDSLIFALPVSYIFWLIGK